MGAPPEPSAAGRVGRGRAAKGASFARQGEASDLELVRTKEQGVSRMLTISLNKVKEKLAQ